MTLLHDNDRVYVLNMFIRNYERIIMIFWLEQVRCTWLIVICVTAN